MAENGYDRSPQLLAAHRSRLLIVDMQEKLLPVIPDRDDLVGACAKLVRGAAILNVPVSCTQQYPRGLGDTVAPLAELLSERVDKVRFSCAECLDWATDANDLEIRHQIVIAGIEAHVCVLQTALDLIAAGFDVFVVADAVRSRRAVDQEMAFRRIADQGGVLVTSEMVLFEWCEVAGTDQFKQISRLVTGR